MYTLYITFTSPPPLHTQILTIRDQFSQLQDEYTQMGVECATLRTMVEERDTFIKTMKTEIYRKEYKNDTAKVDLHNQLLQKDAVIKKLEVRVVCVWRVTLVQWVGSKVTLYILRVCVRGRLVDGGGTVYSLVQSLWVFLIVLRYVYMYMHVHCEARSCELL